MSQTSSSQQPDPQPTPPRHPSTMPTPKWLRVIPSGLRIKLKEKFRHSADRFFDTYLEPWYLRRQQFARQQPDQPLSYYYEARWALEQLHSPFSDAKRNPIKPFQKHFVLPKPNPNGPKDPVDGMPEVPMELCTPFHSKSSADFLKIGRNNVSNMLDILKFGGGELPKDARILDFGCYCGNMMRALAPYTEQGEVWGADLDGDPITWAMLHLTPRFRFLFTNSSPHLPFEDRYFDLIYCGSVFSHIEAPDAWLAELARILRPGGRLYLTMIDKPGLDTYIKDWPDLSISKEAVAFMTPEQLKSDYAQMVINRSPWQHAIFDREFFLNKCRACFDVISANPFVYSYQTAVLLRKRDTARGAKASTASSAALQTHVNGAAISTEPKPTPQTVS